LISLWRDWTELPGAEGGPPGGGPGGET